MRHQEAVELLGVERAAGLHQVVYRAVRCDAEREPEVTELQVEVDEHDLLTAHRERDREVGRNERLAGTALGSEDADQRRSRLAGHGRRALRAVEALMQGDADVLGVGRKRDRILGAGLEDTAQVAVGQVVGQHDDRPLRVLTDRLVDEEQRASKSSARRQRAARRCRVERSPDAVEIVDDADELGRRPLA